ncbi:MAG: hypothetical protein ACI8W8_003079 [Rhodothermales bacterium]|jgi:hypothetical protein
MKIPVFSAMILVLSKSFLLASQVHLQPYNEIAGRVTNVCVLKVDKIESENKFRHFTNEEKKPISETVIVNGTVSRHIHGSFKDNKITTKFTTLVPIKYSDDGKEEMSFSIIKCISGHEHNVDLGKEYIFTYTRFEKMKSNNIMLEWI